MYGNYYPAYTPQNYYNPSGAMPDTLSQYKGQYQPMQPMQQPQYQPISQPMQPNNDMIWVLGEVEATSYPVAPGNTVVLWDRDNDTVYVKSTDPQGKPSMRILDFTERNQKKVSEHKCKCSEKFVSIDEFHKLEKRIADLEGNKNITEDEENG